MKKLGFGLMRLPLLNPQEPASIDHATLNQMVDAYLAHGFTHFDTAYVYHGGKSEEAFRESVVKRYPRDKFTITDKMPIFSINDAARLEEIFQEQLERCGVGFFDYYWLHGLHASRYDLCKELNAFKFVESKRDQGKIGHIGISFHDSAEVLEKILSGQPEIEYVQLQINYLDWEDENVQSRKCYEVAVKYGKKVMVMEPVKGGVLAAVPAEAEAVFSSVNPRMSVPSWALRYAGSLPAVDVVLSGMSNQLQLEDNMSVMDDFKPLSATERDAVERAASVIRNSIAIPCTACHYCTDGCPKKIAIPELFSLYNSYKLTGRDTPTIEAVYFANLVLTRGKPSECIACGECERSCPQRLPIVENLKLIAARFES